MIAKYNRCHCQWKIMKNSFITRKNIFFIIEKFDFIISKTKKQAHAFWQNKNLNLIIF